MLHSFFALKNRFSAQAEILSPYSFNFATYTSVCVRSLTSFLSPVLSFWWRCGNFIPNHGEITKKIRFKYILICGLCNAVCVNVLQKRVRIHIGVQLTGCTLLYMRCECVFLSILPWCESSRANSKVVRQAPSSISHVPFSMACTRRGKAKCDTPQCDTSDPKGGWGIGTSDTGSLVVITRTNINRGGLGTPRKGGPYFRGKWYERTGYMPEEMLRGWGIRYCDDRR